MSKQNIIHLKNEVINQLSVLCNRLAEINNAMQEHYEDLPNYVWRERQEQVQAIWTILDRRSKHGKQSDSR
jgi:hypothetical protein